MAEEKFLFWQKCLTYANVLTCLVGVLVAFAGNSIFFEIHNSYTQEVFFDSQSFSPEVLKLKNWLFGIIGGTIVGFHLLVIWISENAFKKKERWAHQAIVWAMLSWFVIDSGISFYNGALHNIVLINLVALIIIGIPLFMTRKAFY